MRITCHSCNVSEPLNNRPNWTYRVNRDDKSDAMRFSWVMYCPRCSFKLAKKPWMALYRREDFYCGHCHGMLKAEGYVAHVKACLWEEIQMKKKMMATGSWNANQLAGTATAPATGLLDEPS